MAGIGPAIKSTGLTGGTKNGAKPGSLKAQNNKDPKLSKLSIADIKDKEKEVKEGEDTGEVAKDDESQNTGATTNQVDAKDAAKKAVETPRDRLNAHLDEMGKRIDEHRAQMDKGMMDAQAAQQQGQQMDPALLAALNKPQQSPKSSGSGGSTPKSQSKPSSSANDAVKKLAESQKEVNRKQQEQMQKLAEAVKKKQSTSRTSETEDKLKQAQKIIDENKRARAEENPRSSGTEQLAKGKNHPFNQEDLGFIADRVNEIKSGSVKTGDTETLAKFDNLIGQLEDGRFKQSLENLRERFDNKTSSTTTPEEPQVQEHSSKQELEDFDSNSFSANPFEQSRGDDTSLDLEQNFDNLDKELEKNIENNIEENLEDIDEQIQEDLEDLNLDEELDEILEDLDVEPEE